MKAFGHILGSGKLAYHLSAVLISVVAVVMTGLEILPNWQKYEGVEAHWIAQSLAAGKGYSLPPGYRWLLEFVESPKYLKVNDIDGVFQPTAWADPIYTFFLAGLIRVFGDYHQLAAAIFNLLLFLAVLLLTYRLCEHLISALAGVIAVVVLSLEPNIFPNALTEMTNAMLGSALVVFSALMLVKLLEEPSYLRASVLGIVLGFTALECPSALLIIPVTAAALAVWGWKNQRPTILQAILILFAAAIIVLPWTFRNYMVFGKIVPVRTGFGQIAFIGVVATGGMIAPERLQVQATPPLRASHARQAVRMIPPPHYEEQKTLERWQLEYAMERGGAEYIAMNEAQRDSWFMHETMAFLVANPVLSARLTIAKLERFANVFGEGWQLVCLLSALGGVLAIRKPAVLILALWVGSYAVPFLLAICYYPKYRAPIEPLLVMLAVFAFWQVLKAVAPGSWTEKFAV
jgi:hypothetical protein